MIYGENKKLSISQILDIVDKNENVKAFMMCIVQATSYDG